MLRKLLLLLPVLVTRLLEPDVAVENSLEPGDRHSYQIELETGHYLRVAVDQLGADVGIRLADPAGGILTLVDTPTGSWSSEELHHVADEPGAYRLEIVSRGEAAGRYRIHVLPLAQATARERDRCAAERLFYEAREYERVARWSDAAASYAAAAQRFQQSGYVLREADTLYRLGRTYLAAGQPEAAAEILVESVDLYPADSHAESRARALDHLAMALYSTGRSGSARERFLEVLDIYRSLRRPAAQIRTLDNLGAIARQQGRIREALGHLEAALELSQNLGDALLLAGTWNHLGSLYSLAAEPSQALYAHRQALALLEPDGPPERVATTETLLGDALMRADDASAALERYRRALELRRRLGDRRGQAVTLIGLGRTYSRLDQPVRALDVYDEALRLSIALDDDLSLVAALNNLGWLYTDYGEPGRALAFLSVAQEHARTLGYPNYLAAVLFGTARAERQLGELDAARIHVEEAIDLKNTMRTYSLRDDLRFSMMESAQSFYGFLVDLLMEKNRRLPDAGYARRALEVVEQSRTQSLLDALARPDVAQSVATELAERRVKLGEEISSCQGTAGPSELERLIAEHNIIEERIRRSRRSRERKPLPATKSLPEIRDLLEHDTLLLEYYLGEEDGYLWAVSSSGFESYELGRREEIEREARQVLEILPRSYERAAWQRAQFTLARLAERLLGPVVGRLGDRRLVIVPTGILHSIPFAALLQPVEGQPFIGRRPLVDHHEIVYSPSASALAAVRQRTASRPTAAKMLAILADPVFESNDERLEKAPAAPGSPPSRLEALHYARLPATRREALAIMGRIPDPRMARLFTGFDANRGLALSGDLSAYRILHFATHAHLNTEHQELSAIVLSRLDPLGGRRPGLLWAGEIYDLNWPADLIVVSACDTALGRDSRGEGWVGLTHALLAAGSTRVLVTLWPIDDLSTAEFMRHFYDGLLSRGLSPPAALRHAQLCLRTEPKWAAPFYWAGFVLQGDWRAVNPPFLTSR